MRRVYNSRVKFLNLLVTIASVFLIITGLLVLTGWQIDNTLLKSVSPGWIAMNPLTAIAICISGVSLLIISSKNKNSALINSARVLALIVLTIGGLNLLELFGVLAFEIDRVIFTDKIDSLTSSQPNKIAPNTAINLLISGVSLFLLSFSRTKTLTAARLLTVIPLIISLATLVGYLYSTSTLNKIDTIPMAFHTALCSFILSLSIISIKPERGIIKIFVENSATGKVTRQFIPFILFIPLLLGWLKLEGLQTGLYSYETGIALFVVVIIILLIIGVVINAHFLKKSESKRKNAEQKIMALNRQLQKKNRELIVINEDLIAFNYTAAHDLGSPLSGIIGVSEKLMKKQFSDLKEDDLELMHLINTTAVSMNVLLKDLLEFSKISKDTLRKEKTDMTRLVKKTIDEIQMLEPAYKAEIIIKELPIVRADPSLIKQVFRNLLSNALKYSSTSKTPKVEISAQKKAGEIIFFVKDNGVGFDMRQSKKLFQLFKRLHTSAEFEGSGIGLAIVKRIIEKHGGKVWAKARENSGATFYFSLPL